jgi:hypothetical protein
MPSCTLVWVSSLGGGLGRTNGTSVAWLTLAIPVPFAGYGVTILWAARLAEETPANAESAGIPAMMAVSAMTLTVVCVVTATRVNRVLGLLLTGVVTGKLYPADEWTLPPAYRILAFGVGGVRLMGASYVYSRHREKTQALWWGRLEQGPLSTYLAEVRDGGEGGTVSCVDLEAGAGLDEGVAEAGDAADDGHGGLAGVFKCDCRSGRRGGKPGRRPGVRISWWRGRCFRSLPSATRHLCPPLFVRNTTLGPARNSPRGAGSAVPP